ncbi:MAG: hypothetical protein AB7V39_00530 [Nitrospiraceae bacterium]
MNIVSTITLPVSGPLTDTQLRATSVPVTIPTPVPVTDNGGSLTVDGPLTDTQLRATPVPVSGTVTATPTGTQDTNVIQLGGVSISRNSGVTDTGTQRVVLPTNQSAIPVTDNGGSLTVDAVNLSIRSLTRATDAVQISATAVANSALNPIFVSGTNNIRSEPIFQAEIENKRLYGVVTEVNIATTAQTPMVLIRNPIGSGKTLYFQRWTSLITNTANSSAVLRVYLAPTVTLDGTAASIVNTAIGGGGAATVMQAFTSPTISVNGTFAYATRAQGGDGAQSTVDDIEGSISVAPGITLLVTATVDGANRNIISRFLWLEK